jgi:putative SbcD/Mre11-related phosphoesterase
LKPFIPWPVLLFEEKGNRTLIIGDLHLGYEMALAKEGINIPSQTSRLERRLVEVVHETKPNRLIMIGDVKHSIPNISLQEWADIPKFFEDLRGEVNVVDVIPGNHDGDLEPLLPHGINLKDPRGILLGKKDKVGVFHGHTWPSPELLSARHLVTAHNHPMVQFRDPSGFRMIKQAWIKAPCNEKILARKILEKIHLRGEGEESGVFRDRFGIELKRMNIIIMPAFNDILGGVIVNRTGITRHIGPLVSSGATDMNEAEVYLLDGTYIGLVKNLVSRPRT